MRIASHILQREASSYLTALADLCRELVVIEGMGHDLPRDAWPEITDALVRNAKRAA